MSKHNKLIWIVTFCACCMLLAGCAEKPVLLSSGKFPVDTQHISIVPTADDFALLDSFPSLQSVDFSGSESYAEIAAWAQSHPQVNVAYSIKLPDGRQLSHDVTALDLSAMDEAKLYHSLSLLEYLPAVANIKLPDGLSAEKLIEFSTSYPQIVMEYKASAAGISISPEVTEIDLSSAGSAQVQELLPWLPLMTGVQQVSFGSERDDLTWDDISAVKAACPEAKMDFSFSLYGMELTLDETSLDLNHIAIEDNGALVKKIAGCMNKLEYLDMDSCGVSDEAMAEIRDSLPDTKVVWRIWFGERYSVRTDVEKILASNPGMGGELTAENTQSLKYCTEVKYLDVGHNSWLSDISFVAYMPKLEVAVLAMSNWSDIEPLSNCPNLEYAELQTSCLNDLRPISGLKNLKHLNIAYCVALTDITPLYEMTQLERLWIGCLTPIPGSQVDEMRRRVPDCEINTRTLDPTEGGWRYITVQTGLQAVPRYELLRDQFEYHLGVDAYSYYYNDPLY